MPVKSKAQSRFLNWKFGHKWVKKHHFAGETEDLPEKKPEEEKEKKDKKKEEMTTSVNVGGGPATTQTKKTPGKSGKRDWLDKLDPEKRAEKANLIFGKYAKKKKGEEEKKKKEAALRRVMNMVYQEESRLRKINLK